MAKAHRELPAEMRIDKWLKTVRIFKKREEAATACELGRVKLNGQVAKASRPIKVGDQITVKVNKTYRELEVLQIPVRGLSARDAKLAYDEKTPELSEEAKLLLKMQQEAERKNKRKFKGRPTKKERRDLGKLRGL